MEEAVAEFRRLCADIETNFERSQWAQEQGSEGWVGHLARETQEVLDADTIEDRGDKLGDVFWNAVSSIVALQREGGPPLHEVLRAVRTKIRSRKPWVFNGGEQVLSPEDELALWDQVKEQTA